MKRSTQGFTLLELLMVVIIIGILAAVAIPQYLKSAERSRMAEAKTVLGQLRGSEVRYYAQWLSYTTALGSLDFDPSAAGAMTGTVMFGYACPTGTAATFDCTATRNGTQFNAASGCSAGYKLHMGPTGLVAASETCTSAT